MTCTKVIHGEDGSTKHQPAKCNNPWQKLALPKIMQWACRSRNTRQSMETIRQIAIFWSSPEPADLSYFQNVALADDAQKRERELSLFSPKQIPPEVRAPDSLACPYTRRLEHDNPERNWKKLETAQYRENCQPKYQARRRLHVQITYIQITYTLCSLQKFLA